MPLQGSVSAVHRYEWMPDPRIEWLTSLPVCCVMRRGGAYLVAVALARIEIAQVCLPQRSCPDSPRCRGGNSTLAASATLPGTFSVTESGTRPLPAQSFVWHQAAQQENDQLTQWMHCGAGTDASLELVMGHPWTWAQRSESALVSDCSTRLIGRRVTRVAVARGHAVVGTSSGG